jgi:hypothetical protein
MSLSRVTGQSLRAITKVNGVQIEQVEGLQIRFLFFL